VLQFLLLNLLCCHCEQSYLCVGGNGFSDSLPTSIFSMTNLVELKLSDNQITGSVATEFGTLNNIQDITLRNNLFSGNLPSEIGQLSFLRTLDVSGCNGISGSIPVQIAFLSNLEKLHLEGTSIEGNLDLLFCTGDVSYPQECVFQSVINFPCFIAQYLHDSNNLTEYRCFNLSSNSSSRKYLRIVLPHPRSVLAVRCVVMLLEQIARTCNPRIQFKIIRQRTMKIKK
jgi:Leucine-rich repeat (LRR) protein